MLIIQLTALSGAGKTTLSALVKRTLALQNIAVEVIDGDVYRETLCRDLGFSRADRCENIRRLGKVAGKLATENDVVIIAAINPYEEIRRELRETYSAKTIWLNCPVAELIKRDTKGMYRRALLPNGHPDKINNLTGINDAYDLPEVTDLVIDTYHQSVDESVSVFCDFILQQMRDTTLSKR